MINEDKLWAIRAFVYQHFAEMAHPPLVDEVASRFDLTQEEATAAYDELHQRHALFLKPGTHEILMANPFSGVETPFQVHANDKIYFANCAWDTFGIPAALQVDAKIEATCAQSGEPIRISVIKQQVQDSDALVHFLIPFREWYNDLAFT
ncbi:MAG TPA: organomercurial lyase [Anaerolineales bacterium]|nr:organomercurial lyase [Anaerolineales bacterium]